MWRWLVLGCLKSVIGCLVKLSGGIWGAKKIVWLGLVIVEVWKVLVVLVVWVIMVVS